MELIRIVQYNYMGIGVHLNSINKIWELYEHVMII